MIHVEPLGGFGFLTSTSTPIVMMQSQWEAEVASARQDGITDERRRCASIAAEVRNRHGGLAYDVAAMIEARILSGEPA